MKLFENNYRSRFKLTSDQVFYWVYGMDTEESKRALIALLNVVLDRKDDPIIEVRLLNPVQKGFVIGDKPTVMDIKCETSSGELIDVEMQNGRLPFYPERSLFYGGKMVNSALEEGEDYDKMKKSIVISFIDGVIFPQVQCLHTEFLMQEKQAHFTLTDKLSIHFLELGKIDGKKDPADMTPLECLCAYIRGAGDGTREDYVNKLLETGEEAVNMSEYVFKKLTEDDIAREMLERQIKAEHDNATWLKYAKEDGLTQGRDEGYDAAMIEIAQKMKRAGKPLEEIKAFTGLEAETIEKL